MKGENLLHAMDGIDEAILEKSINTTKKPRQRAWLPAIAACLALILGIGLLWPKAPASLYQLPQVRPLENAGSHSILGLRYEGTEPQDTGKFTVVSPQDLFHQSPVVLARAVEVLPDVYASIPAYGLGSIYRWRIFKLEIIDPLDSGLEGPLWFGIPEGYYQDLTAYDSLLLSLSLQGFDHTLKNTTSGSLQAFDRFYADPIPYHGDTVAFTDGIFDESLWSQGYWADPPYFYFSAYKDLDRELNTLIVHRGSTVEDALAVIEARRSEPDFVLRDNYVLSPAAQAAMDSLDPDFIGTGLAWGPDYKERYLEYTRYIGGCLTNEYVLIHPETGEMLYSDARFEAGDLEGLPDLRAFTEELVLDAQPLPPDEIRGQLLYRAAYAWYEKTEKGVLAFVKVVWYHDSLDTRQAYVVYDDLYLAVTLEGAQVCSRQEMASLLGPGNDNLDYFADLEGTIHMLWKY